jgi:hypothetical protein
MMPSLLVSSTQVSRVIPSSASCEMVFPCRERIDSDIKAVRGLKIIFSHFSNTDRWSIMLIPALIGVQVVSVFPSLSLSAS